MQNDTVCAVWQARISVVAAMFFERNASHDRRVLVVGWTTCGILSSIVVISDCLSMFLTKKLMVVSHKKILQSIRIVTWYF